MKKANQPLCNKFFSYSSGLPVLSVRIFVRWRKWSTLSINDGGTGCANRHLQLKVDLTKRASPVKNFRYFTLIRIVLASRFAFHLQVL